MDCGHLYSASSWRNVRRIRPAVAPAAAPWWHLPQSPRVLAKLRCFSKKRTAVTLKFSVDMKKLVQRASENRIDVIRLKFNRKFIANLTTWNDFIGQFEQMSWWTNFSLWNSYETFSCCQLRQSWSSDTLRAQMFWTTVVQVLSISAFICKFLVPKDQPLRLRLKSEKFYFKLKF